MDIVRTVLDVEILDVQGHLTTEEHIVVGLILQAQCSELWPWDSREWIVVELIYCDQNLEDSKCQQDKREH